MSRTMTKRVSVLFAFMLLFQTLLSSFAMPAQIIAAEPQQENVIKDVQPVSNDEQDDAETVALEVTWSVDGLAVESGDEDTYHLVDLNENYFIETEQIGDITAESEVKVGEYVASEDGVITLTFNDEIEENPEAADSFVIDVIDFVVREAAAAENEKVEEEAAEENPEGENPEEENQGEEAVDSTSDETDITEADEDTDSEGSNEEENADNEGTDEADAEDEIVEDPVAGSSTSGSIQSDIGTFAEIEQNIFRFLSMTLNDEEIEDNSTIDLSDDTRVRVEFEWDTEGLDVYNGDTASMQLPDAFQQVNISGLDITTIDGTVVGTYRLQDGELQFLFNEKIEDGNVTNGIVGFNLDFNMEKFEENIEQVIQFNDRDETTLNVLARPSGEISGITKEGHPDRDRDAREITWTIDIMNDNDEPITDATLKDVLPDGLGEPRDFIIHELSVGINGDKRVGSEADFDEQVDGNEFTLNFPEIAPFNGYQIEYTTTIEDYSIDSFTNDASFSYDDTNLPAEATVDGLERSNPIQKDGNYNWNTHQIDWTITVNESGGEIDEAIVDDTLPAEQSLVEGSIEVSKYDSNWGNEEIITDVSADFPIHLGEVTANEIYQIEFSTNIDWSEVNGGEYQHHNQFTNETELRDGDITVGGDDATVDHWRDNLLEKSGASNVDYDNNTLTWTVEVNNAKHPLDNVVVNDVIPEGLSISEGDISITGEDGEAYEGATPTVDGQNVQINLGNIGTDTITIKYTTTITDFTIDEFDNQATLEGDGIGIGEGEDPPNDNDIITPPANSFAKGFKGIDYNERTIDWGLTVNPIREAITDLTIVDTFPNKGMIMLPDTLEIRVGGEEVEGGFSLTPNDEDGETGYHKGFTIEFDNDLLPLNAQMEISYQTSYDPQREVEGNTLDPHVGGEDKDRVYENHAQFTGNTEHENDFDTGRDANTTVREDSWNSGYKEGQLVHEDSEGNQENGWQSGSERKIAWQLYTNYQEQNLGTGVVIQDKLDYEGTIDEGSVVVSVYNVDAAGNTTITDEVLSDGDYSVNYEDDSFTLTFTDDFRVNERYVVQFTTTVPNISQPNYVNNATVIVGDDEYPYQGTVNYDKHDAFLDKSTGHEGSDVYIGDEVNWEINVNESLSIIQNPVITDTISAGMEYVEGTLEISTASGDVLNEGEDYSLSNEKNEDDETVLTITLQDILSEMLTLNYTTVVTAEDGDSVSNEVNLDGEDIEVEKVTSEELRAEEFSWVSGEFNERRGALRIIKMDSETEEPIENNSATFELYYELNNERVLFTDDIQTDENGVVEIGNLPLRTYYLQEVEAPTGYVIDEEEQVIEVSQPYGTEEHVYEVEFSNTIEKTDISVLKEWDDAENQDGQRPGSIEVQLLADGKAVEDPEILSDDNEWTHTWEDLDGYQSNGEIIDYTVEEIKVPEGYESSVNVEDDNSITITNTPETIEVSVSKEWEDEENQDGVRPNNVTVNLLNGSEIVTKVVLNENNDWQHTFTDLPKFDAGEEIQYSVTEDNVANYSTSYETTNTDGDLNSVITNTYTPGVTTAKVTKLWEDAGNQDGNRPDSVTVQLLANGEPYGSPVVLTATNNWTDTWTNLDMNSDGEAIEYTVEELEVGEVHEDYEVSVNNEDHGNLVITNTYEPETTEISVLKEWEDADNQDGVRPENVTINLLAGGEVERTAVVDAEADWQHTFTNLPVSENGEEIIYTVTENTVTDYSASIENNLDIEADQDFVITNTHTPNETSVTVTKGWNDENNQAGFRPDSIEVQLYAGDDPHGEVVELKAEEGWTHTWTELAANADGDPIEYTVDEVNVPNGYDVAINDTNHGNIIITNTHEPEETEIEVTKVWDDNDNQDNIRPSNVTVNLLANENLVGQTVLDDENDWQHTFTNLPVYEIGKEIDYRVTENDVSNYDMSIEENEDSDAENALNIINSYTPEVTTISGEKIWDDGDNQDGNRPETITVNLLADGNQVDSVEVTEETNWKYSFEDMPTHENGEEISYTVAEKDSEDLEAYETTIDGYDITNSYTPETTTISGEKVWEDANNQDGNRPAFITVNLLVDGEKIDDAIVSPETGWQYSFDNLPVYEDGAEIEYTIEEVPVEGYETEIDDDNNITNTYVPETTEVTVSKEWEDADNQDGERPESVTVNLLNNNGAVIDDIELNEDNEWGHTFTDLPKYENGQEINYSVTEDTVSEYSTSIVKTETEDGINNVITNSYTPGETSVTVTKGWNDGNNQDGNRPTSVQVQITAEGEAVENQGRVTLDESNNWTHTWSGLPEYADGDLINYSAEEIDVPAGYTESVNDNNHGNIIITNSYTPELTEVPVTKVWDDADNQDGERPTQITLNLLNDRAEIVKSAVVEEQEGNEWNYTFTDIPKYENGEEINYRVTENFVSDYSTTVEENSEVENGYIVTNTLTPEQTSVTVTKGWNDANNQDDERPENIEVQLTADGEAIGDAQTLSEENNWTYTWNELDLYADGEEVNYSVEEVNIPEGYTSSINDNDHGNIIITNNYTPETTEIPVTKVWNDDEDRDRVRPNNVTVNLLADGEIVRQAVLNEARDWEHVFNNLPVYENGTEIDYSLTENTVLEYSTSVEENENGFVVTNSYTPDETTATITKKWNDADNQDGIRPETIEVQLLANDEATGDPVEIYAEDGWTYTWEGLPLNADGEPINYSVEELNVPEGYETTVNDEDHGNLILTNNHTPEEINITGTKTWDDANNQDGIRPATITVNLFANDDFVESVEVTEADEWSYSFDDLPKFEAGEEITYTITEDEVEGYEAEQDGFDITNIHTPEVIDVNGLKTWDDADNQDGIRPEAITVNLLANGEPVDSTEVTEEDDWSYSFTDLPKNEAGEEIVYAVTEDTVEDYTQTIDGFDMTNSYTPETTEVAGTKTWDDADNQDGNRPDAITVNLLANGEQVDSTDVTAETDWSYSFTDLPKYEAGEAIVYTVTENTVEAYTQTIDGHDITNHYTPGETTVTVTKNWDDNNNKAENRPETIEVQLTADGENVGEPVELSSENDWTYTWTALDEKAEGEAIEYSVIEVTELPEYVTVINDENHGNIIITNSPAKVSIGDYVWFDENRDGLQDDTDVPIEGVVLTVEDENGDPVTDVYGNPVEPTTTDENGYYTFDNLPIDHTYTVRIDQEASEEALKDYLPTLHEVGDDNAIDSSTWEATSRHLTEDGERDPTLDFGFVVPEKVSVGDYVWIDENKDGLQDETDTPLEGVVLTIEDENGDPVTDVYGNPVEPTTTDENGYYIFENLPIDHTYTVRIDREASADALKGYVPTLHEVGDDNSIDSSTWEAISRYLTEDGEHDPTLDFGFVRVEDPETPEEPETPGEEDPETPEEPETPGEEDPDTPEDTEETNGDDSSKDGEEPKDKVDTPESTNDTDETEDVLATGTGEPTDSGDGDRLPSTATNIYNLLAIGLVLIALAIGITIYRRRKSA